VFLLAEDAELPVVLPENNLCCNLFSLTASPQGEVKYNNMSTITAADINKLRQATGAGMMDCRKALTESNGDFEAAIDWLRKQGQKVAAKRSDREAKEGVVLAKTTADHKAGIVLCISCETDFVSKNADFVAFANSIADAGIAHNVKSAEELSNVEINGAKVSDMINDKLAAIGEKLKFPSSKEWMLLMYRAISMAPTEWAYWWA